MSITFLEDLNPSPERPTPARTAEQILADANSGNLAPVEIKIKETARLTITDLETGDVQERVISERTGTLDEIL